MNFQDFKLNKQLFDAIADLGYEKPTPIQEKAIPLLLAGHDLMGVAQTGTGKTAAFVLPLLMKLKYAQGKNPRALIITPTRELAIQIDKTLIDFGKYCDLRHVCLYGGIGMKTQIEDVEKGIDIVVATPGRLMDIYFKEVLIVKEVKTLILDEADKMMDMGFMPQIRNLLEILPQKKQKILFSATMPDKVITLSEEFLEFPMMVEITPQATTAETVEQELYEVPNLQTKINFLLQLLEDKEVFNRVIVFARSKRNADNIFKYLSRKLGEEDIRVIHANKGQNTRINSMDDFKEGNIRILVATDVVSRGIDVSMVSHVINFDVPIIYEDYVHRIGRTGRANQVGKAITFSTMAEQYHLEKIENIIKIKIPRKELPEFVKVVETPYEENQAMLKEIDNQKKKDDPDFKGAFHEKKKKNDFSRPKKVNNNSKKGLKTGKFKKKRT